MSDKAKVLECLYRTPLPGGAIEFEALLKDTVEVALGKSPMDAEQFSKANLQKYWNWLLQSIDYDKSSGIQEYFHIPNPKIHRVECYGWKLTQSTDQRQKALGKRLVARPHLQSAINNLGHRQYEALGCLVSKIAGASQIHLTAPGNEGGIDFFALIDVPAKSHVFGGLNGRLRVVGQSKKYASAADVLKVDQFNATMGHVRHRSARVDAVIPGWFHACRGPIVGWMIGHSGFQIGGVNLAKTQGIVLSDSRDMTEILGSSKTFHGNVQPAGRAALVGRDVNVILEQFP